MTFLSWFPSSIIFRSAQVCEIINSITPLLLSANVFGEKQ